MIGDLECAICLPMLLSLTQLVEWVQYLYCTILYCIILYRLYCRYGLSPDGDSTADIEGKGNRIIQRIHSRTGSEQKWAVINFYGAQFGDVAPFWGGRAFAGLKLYY